MFYNFYLKLQLISSKYFSFQEYFSFQSDLHLSVKKCPTFLMTKLRICM